MKEISSPKRRKSKDNPYIINHIENNNTYIVIFKNNNKEEKVQISKDVYDAFNQFELDDLRQLNESDRHYEKLEQNDEFLFKRGFEEYKSLEDQVEQKILYENIRKAINELSNIQKSRLIKYYFQNKTLDEIAIEEHTSHQAISKSISMGIEKIRKNLKF